MSINVLQELQEYKLEPQFESETHVKVRCPFHGDRETPNLSVRIRETPEGPLGNSHCFACGQNWTFVQLLTKYQQLSWEYRKNRGEKVSSTPPDEKQVSEYLVKKYNLAKSEGAISPRVVDEYAAQIWEAKPLLKELYDRALTDDVIKKYKLGRDQLRITIPFFDVDGRCVNIQKYQPGATRLKFTNSRGRGETRLYPLDQLRYQKIVLTAGPIKALAGIAHLNSNNIGCMTATGGEEEWLISFNESFRGKEIYLVYDVDAAGVAGAVKVAKALYSVAASVKIITLEFANKERFPKGGLDDYLANETGILELIANAEEYEPPQVPKYSDDDPCKTVSVNEAFNPEISGERLELEVSIVSVCDTPCFLPKDYEVSCSRDAKGLCAVCPVSRLPPNTNFKGVVYPESPTLLTLYENPDSYRHKALMKETGIPLGCKRCGFKTLSLQTANEVRVSAILDIEDTSMDRSNQPALIVGDVESGSDYKLTGRMYPHPATQKATLVCSKADPITSDLQNWKQTEAFSVFQPKEWTLESLSERVEEIYAYIGDKVSHIYRRPDMHIVMDLTYHSVLMFKLGNRLQKGWINSLIVGDSAQGKSETATAFRKLYKLGFRVDSKMASLAGLIGGNTQLGDSGKFFVKWGAIPVNDGGLVLIEELGGLSVEIFGKLTDTRSEGIAQLPKIEAKSTKARTRLIVNSNPRSKRGLDTYTYGVDAVVELVGAPQDIRRFDIATCVSLRDNDIRPSELAYGSIPTDSQFRECVRYAWTRTAEQCIIGEELEALIKAETKKLCNTYVEERVPLIDAGTTHLKISKLAIALAIRTGSTEGENVIVRECHVLYIVQLLDRLYSDRCMGYKAYSRGIKALNSIGNEQEVKQVLASIVYRQSFVEGLLYKDFVEKQDIMDWGGISPDECASVLATLVRNRCLIRKNRNGYIKSPGFVQFLHNYDPSEEPQSLPPTNPQNF